VPKETKPSGSSPPPQQPLALGGSLKKIPHHAVSISRANLSCEAGPCVTRSSQARLPCCWRVATPRQGTRRASWQRADRLCLRCALRVAEVSFWACSSPSVQPQPQPPRAKIQSVLRIPWRRYADLLDSPPLAQRGRQQIAVLIG
jgi:hypothetical protein